MTKGLQNGEYKVGQGFINNDLDKRGDEDEEIKNLDTQTLAILSKFPELMK